MPTGQPHHIWLCSCVWHLFVRATRSLTETRLCRLVHVPVGHILSHTSLALTLLHQCSTRTTCFGLLPQCIIMHPRCRGSIIWLQYLRGQASTVPWIRCPGCRCLVIRVMPYIFVSPDNVSTVLWLHCSVGRAALSCCYVVCCRLIARLGKSE